jgi:hypothetical protein
MSQILIEIDTPEDEAILLSLLPKLNCRVIKRMMPAPKSNESPVAILKRIAERGGALSFGDPSEWQREIRSWDRVLDGREE